jgi:thiosulfate/3-mercaptopyruvate sulfurtransferase
VWWTFKVFGHQRVSVLDGGLPAWKREGGELESSTPEAYPTTTYPVPHKDDSLVRSFEQITDLARQGTQSVQILDARSVGRYAGSVVTANVQIHWQGSRTTQRYLLRGQIITTGLSSGHIPGSISLPFQNLLDTETKQYKNVEELRAFFEKELDPAKETIASCGTGIYSGYTV